MSNSIIKLVDFAGCALALADRPADQWAILWRETKNLRVRLRLAHYHPDQIFSLNTKFGRLSFRDNFGDITNLTNLLYRQVYRWKSLSAPGAILDVGANIGLAGVWFLHHNPERPLYCFEPLPENGRMISLNAPLAHVETSAVGAQPGQITLTVDPDSTMASRVPNARNLGEQRFQVITLDDFAAGEKLHEIGLLKVDAEGMEVEILAGAKRMLVHTGQVVIETHGLARHQACLQILITAGFEIEAEKHAAHTGMIFARRL